MNPKINLAERMLQKEGIKRCELEECRGACCLHGVWLDRLEKDQLMANETLISPYMREEYRESRDWFEGEYEADSHSLSGKVIHSRVVADERHYGGTACVFWKPDGKCALQVAAVEGGFHPWHFKPFYCILHPLDLDDEGRITLDETASLLDEPASCLRPAESSVRVFKIFEEEIRYLLGDRAYQEILKVCPED